jgi:carboxypeptidase Taq
MGESGHSFFKKIDMSNQLYEQYKDRLVRLADVQHSASVLHWDMETYMPPKGARFRGQQLATLSGIAHEMFTDPAFGELLDNLAVDQTLNWEEERNVAETKHDYDRDRKLSKEFVEKLTRTTSEAFQAWHKAKTDGHFPTFAPLLEKIIDLKLEQADLLGYEGHPYNALLDEFEPGMTVAVLDKVFEGLKPRLLAILDKVNNSPKPDTAFARQPFDKDKQWQLGLELLKRMNYDFDAGRQDLSSHPFSTSFSPEDARVTTRINDTDVLDMIGSCVHEGGHALYEQGLLPENYGLPAGTYVSLGIHESQ